MRILALLLLAALACPIQAQSAPCLAFNDTTNFASGALSTYGFAGPNRRAWQITTPTAAVIAGIRVYTGNTLLSGDIFMSLEIYSDSSGLPGTRLGGGTWKIVPASAWQGATLDQPVTLAAGSSAWVVWSDPGFSALPLDSGGLLLPTVTPSGGTWAVAPSSALKVRLYCGPLDGPGIANLGPSCLGGNGSQPAAFTNQTPAVGNASFAVEATGWFSNQPVLLAYGVMPNWVSLPNPLLPLGCAQNTDIVDTLFAVSGSGNSRGPTAAGHVRFALPIPNDPGMLGGFVAFQAAGFDVSAQAIVPLVTTNGVQVTVQ